MIGISIEMCLGNILFTSFAWIKTGIFNLKIIRLNPMIVFLGDIRTKKITILYHHFSDFIFIQSTLSLDCAYLINLNGIVT